jgi:hypothetical protein
VSTTQVTSRPASELRPHPQASELPRLDAADLR